MIPVQLDYAAPESLEAAVKLLTENEGAEVLNAGHSLLAAIKLGRASPSLLVDLRKIPGLEGIESSDGAAPRLKIGAKTTYARIAADAAIAENYPALAEAANSIGDAQIRNWETIGDVFAYRDLACELPAIALALEATFHLVGPGGPRSLPADEWIVSASQAKLQPGDILTAIDLPLYGRGTGSAWEGFKHAASGYALCGTAVLLSLGEGGTVSKCRAAVTGAYAGAERLHEVERSLEGKAPTADNIKAAAKLAAAIARAASDEMAEIFNLYASAEYRAHLTGVLTERSLTRAAARAGFNG